MKDKNSEASLLSRRQLLVSAGAVAGASLLPMSMTSAQQGRPDVVFTNTTVVSNDAERRTLRNVSLAVRNNLIAAIGSNEEISILQLAQVVVSRRSSSQRRDNECNKQ